MFPAGIGYWEGLASHPARSHAPPGAPHPTGNECTVVLTVWQRTVPWHGSLVRVGGADGRHQGSGAAWL
jgi:hypothetical protein